MNFLSMEYFLVIAEEKSFSRAANKLFVSQQSLSEHIKKLEKELDAPLFVRGSTLSLTVAGKCLQRGATKMLQVRNITLQEIANVTNKRHRNITVAISTFDLPPFLPNLLANYAETYPDVTVHIVKRLVSDIAYSMDGVDLYISYLPLADELEHEIILENDPYVACVCKSLMHNVYGEGWERVAQEMRRTGDLNCFAQLPFVQLYDRYGNLARDLERIYAGFHMSPTVGFQSENADLNVSMCVRGIGAMLMPQGYFRDKMEMVGGADAKEMLVFPILPPDFKTCLAFSHTKGRKLHESEKNFIAMARKMLAQKQAALRE